jgi:hypothetical protein
LTKEEEKKFEAYITNCREGASKLGFLKRGGDSKVSIMLPFKTSHLLQKPKTDVLSRDQLKKMLLIPVPQSPQDHY